MGPADRPTLLALPALLRRPQNALREGRGAHELGDDSRGSQEGRKRVWAEPGATDHTGLEGLQVSALAAALAPQPLHTPGGLGVHSSQLSSAVSPSGPQGLWGTEAGLFGELAVAVSEVKLIQVPGALPARGAPHPAVVALQVFLPLPLLLGLFRSLHLGEGGRAGWGAG